MKWDGKSRGENPNPFNFPSVFTSIFMEKHFPNRYFFNQLT